MRAQGQIGELGLYRLHADHRQRSATRTAAGRTGCPPADAMEKPRIAQIAGMASGPRDRAAGIGFNTVIPGSIRTSRMQAAANTPDVIAADAEPARIWPPALSR